MYIHVYPSNDGQQARSSCTGLHIQFLLFSMMSCHEHVHVPFFDLAPILSLEGQRMRVAVEAITPWKKSAALSLSLRPAGEGGSEGGMEVGEGGRKGGEMEGWRDGGMEGGMEEERWGKFDDEQCVCVCVCACACTCIHVCTCVC